MIKQTLQIVINALRAIAEADQGPAGEFARNTLKSIEPNIEILEIKEALRDCQEPEHAIYLLEKLQKLEKSNGLA